MPIDIGGTTLSDIRIGGTAVTKVYCGSEEIWPVLAGFSSSASYTGGQVSFATTSVAPSTISTAGSTAAWTVDSVDTFANNAATDGQSSLSFDQLGATVNYDGVFDDLSPLASQVFNSGSNTFTQNYTEDGTSTARRRYTNSITVSPVDTSATTRTPNARGIVPSGYSNSDENIVIQVSVPIAGDDAQDPPARAIPASYGGGTLAAGSSVVRNGPVSPIERNGTQTVAAAGTYSFDISGEASPTNGDTDTYSITNISTSYTAGLDTNYAWTVTGGTINSGQGTTSISVTWTTDGAGSVAASNSFAGLAGPNFSASDSHPVNVASAGCTGTASVISLAANTSASAGCFGLIGCEYSVSSNSGYVVIGTLASGTAAVGTMGTVSGCVFGGTFGAPVSYSPGNGTIVCSGTGVTINQPGTTTGSPCSSSTFPIS